MKRIGLLSDTHSYWDDRYAAHFAGCDEIWHAGDVGDPSILLRLREVAPTVRAVAGNADGGEVSRRCPRLLDFCVEGLRVVLTHIGGYPGKYAPGVKSMLRERGAQMLVCGHSHILRVGYDRELGLLCVNPGAAGVQGWQQVRTLVRFAIDNATPRDLEVIELTKNHLPR